MLNCLENCLRDFLQNLASRTIFVQLLGIAIIPRDDRSLSGNISFFLRLAWGVPQNARGQLPGQNTTACGRNAFSTKREFYYMFADSFYGLCGRLRCSSWPPTSSCTRASISEFASVTCIVAFSRTASLCPQCHSCMNVAHVPILLHACFLVIRERKKTEGLQRKRRRSREAALRGSREGGRGRREDCDTGGRSGPEAKEGGDDSEGGGMESGMRATDAFSCMSLHCALFFVSCCHAWIERERERGAHGRERESEDKTNVNVCRNANEALGTHCTLLHVFFAHVMHMFFAHACHARHFY